MYPDEGSRGTGTDKRRVERIARSDLEPHDLRTVDDLYLTVAHADVRSLAPASIPEVRSDAGSTRDSSDSAQRVSARQICLLDRRRRQDEGWRIADLFIERRDVLADIGLSIPGQNCTHGAGIECRGRQRRSLTRLPSMEGAAVRFLP